MTLPDSLLHVIRTKDSLLAAAATRPITFNVAPARDLFDWLSLAGVLLVAPAAAVCAALWGAKYGVERGSSLAREEQDRLQGIMEDRMLRELLHVFSQDVQALGLAASELTESAGRITSFMPTLGNRLEVMSSGFLARRSSVFLLDDLDDRDRMERFYRGIGHLSGMVAGWHQEERDALDETRAMPEASTSPKVAIGRFEHEAQEGRAFLDRLHARYPQFNLIRLQ